MTVPNLTSQHIDFNSWLEQCPVQWFKKYSEDEFAVYEFIFDDLPEDDE
jgi:hypothetical protein